MIFVSKEEALKHALMHIDPTGKRIHDGIESRRKLTSEYDVFIDIKPGTTYELTAICGSLALVRDTITISGDSFSVFYMGHTGNLGLLEALHMSTYNGLYDWVQVALSTTNTTTITRKTEEEILKTFGQVRVVDLNSKTQKIYGEQDSSFYSSSEAIHIVKKRRSEQDSWVYGSLMQNESHKFKFDLSDPTRPQASFPQKKKPSAKRTTEGDQHQKKKKKPSIQREYRIPNDIHDIVRGFHLNTLVPVGASSIFDAVGVGAVTKEDYTQWLRQGNGSSVDRAVLSNWKQSLPPDNILNFLSQQHNMYIMLKYTDNYNSYPVFYPHLDYFRQIDDYKQSRVVLKDGSGRYYSVRDNEEPWDPGFHFLWDRFDRTQFAPNIQRCDCEPDTMATVDACRLCKLSPSCTCADINTKKQRLQRDMDNLQTAFENLTPEEAKDIIYKFGTFESAVSKIQHWPRNSRLKYNSWIDSDPSQCHYDEETCDPGNADTQRMCQHCELFRHDVRTCSNIQSKARAFDMDSDMIAKKYDMEPRLARVLRSQYNSTKGVHDGYDEWKESVVHKNTPDRRVPVDTDYKVCSLFDEPLYVVKASGNLNNCLFHSFLMSMHPELNPTEIEEEGVRLRTRYSMDVRAKLIRGAKNNGLIDENMYDILAEDYKVNILLFTGHVKHTYHVKYPKKVKSDRLIIAYNESGHFHFDCVELESGRRMLAVNDEIRAYIESHMAVTYDDDDEL